MSNHCRNILFASHTDKRRVAALHDSFLKHEFFNSVVRKETPDPDGAWCRKHWGCDSEWFYRGGVFHSGNLVVMGFVTSWTPPIGVYKAMVAAGWDLIAYYSEPDCGFCGRFANDNNAYFKSTNSTSADLRRHLPVDLDLILDLSWRTYLEDLSAANNLEENMKVREDFSDACLYPDVWMPRSRYPGS